MAIIACSLQNFLSKSDKGFFLLIERNNFEQSKTEIEKPRDRPPQTSPINDHQASKKKKKNFLNYVQNPSKNQVKTTGSTQKQTWIIKMKDNPLRFSRV